VPGVQVAKGVLKGSWSVWPNCKYISHISIPSFQFHQAGVDGFHFESCVINMLASGENNGDSMTAPWTCWYNIFWYMKKVELSQCSIRLEGSCGKCAAVALLNDIQCVVCWDFDEE
jgi:hypothetical protein